AGARAMVNTAGGGFALMTEGLSLAGAIESPLVIHLAQRPAPATGLPTRTEQADLEMALYSGHGEFPRVIFAPGTLQEAITLTAKAFNIADKYQVPVFILTDQYFLDMYSNESEVDLKEFLPQYSITQTETDYKRYQLNKTGVSPRGIPGFGQGIVCVDSDEHNEGGYITESASMRKNMVNKRLQKLQTMREDLIDYKIVGKKNAAIVVIGWGSTFPMIKEAIEKLGRKDVTQIHCPQVYPLPEKLGEILKKAKTAIIVENNATSQFGKLIRTQTGFNFAHRILKYDGMAFSVENIIQGLSEIIREIDKEENNE
ncbi:MAG: 2-oxoacid:acceptor oxidoreductase subunit alpha, partial [Candidatus Margulisbacteria bacterium]|nr:2-oxoacid:acceptor oxidoreductase subunit alpha [Candidatus Margulisiibacteriota bacterium]